MKKRKYISPEFEKLELKFTEDCLDASAPGGHGEEIGDDWWNDLPPDNGMW